ncbi:hypothetical protein OG871_40100 (plasmid) [Kitasatospora sp. NBC_00374]|uniref:hypothetical protein n=1 Tax=Kitasatospora sp. NBC_00374 TaxID=2975964 RepID=UPI002F910A92
MAKRRSLDLGRAALDLTAATPTVPAARRPQWLPTAALEQLVERSRALVEACEEQVAGWEENVLSTDADELHEHAGQARSAGLNPVSVVDTVVRAALGDLVSWEAALSGLASALRKLSDEAGLVGFHPDAVAAGQGLDERLAWARYQLLSAVAEYHHGSAGPRQRSPRPW